MLSGRQSRRGLPPGLSNSPVVSYEEPRRKSRSCSILPVGEGPGVRGAAGGGGEHAPEPLAESWGLEGADETGEPKTQGGHPQSQKEKPWRKSGTFPSLPALGVGSPTPLLSASSSAFVGCDSQPTPNRRPLTPLVEGRIDAHFSLQSTPRAEHNRFQDPGTGPAILAGVWPSDLLLCICK